MNQPPTWQAPPPASPAAPTPPLTGSADTWPPSSTPPPPAASSPPPEAPPLPDGAARRTLLAALAALAITAGAGILAGALLYNWVVVGLPDPSELARRAAAFRSTRILDRHGALLSEAFDPNAGRRTVLRLTNIQPQLVQATIATEDANFYRHPGIDPVALLRAVWYAVRERHVVSGASTIPQQLVKLVLLSPERSFKRKFREAILAAEITRRYSKDQILELYLNEVFYGSHAYGIAAAAETFFGKSAGALNLAEAALLAGLPQAPAYYDPYANPERAKRRQRVVLGLMVEQRFITQAQADAAFAEPLAYLPLRFDLKAPHFSLLVREEVEKLLGPEALYRAGLVVTTTLDAKLQEQAEQIVAAQVKRLAAKHVTNGALVAMRPADGEVLAFVGSADFTDEAIGGQVNMALAPRQPGSSLKPFVYLATFQQPARPKEERWTPGTLIADVHTEFPDGANPPYVPVNYDGQEHGLVTARAALANSYNIPAVKALQSVGLADYLALLKSFGVTTLTRNDYGLSLALGSGEIPLIEVTTAFGVLANEGRRVAPVTMRQIANADGTVLCGSGKDDPCLPEGAGAQGDRLVDPVDSFLVGDILSDNEARRPAFGPHSVLELSRRAAVKTGTTNDYRDNLTVGYTPRLVTGVWVGNADNTPMRGVSGVSGAGPIWHDFMELALKEEPDAWYDPPAGVRQFEICADTGTLPSSACPEHRSWYFADDRPPLSADHDLWQVVRLDASTGGLAHDLTPPDQVREEVFKVYPDELRTWAIEHGIPQPPEAPPEGERAARVEINAPPDGSRVSGSVTLRGWASVPDFGSYLLRAAPGGDPDAIRFGEPFVGPYDQPVDDDVLGVWDTTGLLPGPYVIQLVVQGRSGRAYAAQVTLELGAPAGSATDTPTATATFRLAMTLTPTPLLPSATPTGSRPTLTPPLRVTPTNMPRRTSSPTRTPRVIPSRTPLPPSSTPAPPTAAPPTAAPPSAPPPTDAPPSDTPPPRDTETPAPPVPPFETATP